MCDLLNNFIFDDLRRSLIVIYIYSTIHETLIKLIAATRWYASDTAKLVRSCWVVTMLKIRDPVGS